ncbi:MAG: porin family protein [Prevotella sp.]|nr:porin family protein [Prevotella sp.]
MKKIFTLILVAVATMVAVPASAQVQFGLKGGLNVTSMSFSEKVLSKENRAGFFIGPTAKFTLPIVGLGVDASALYDQREAEVEGDKIKQQAINIPINLRYGIGLGETASIYFAAGPQFGFNVGDKEHKLTDGETWKLSGSTLSVNFGLGVMILNHVQIGANYNLVCGKTGELSVLEGAGNALKNKGRANAWQISAAYYF